MRFHLAPYLVALVLLGAQAPLRAQPIVVATRQAPPFVLKTSDGEWSGPAVDLWRHAANKLERPYTLREMDLESTLSALERGEIDVAVGPLSVTAGRESRFDFTHPFHTTGVGIATRTLSSTGPLATMALLLSQPFLTAAGSLLLFLFVAGMVIYLLERRANAEHFGGGWWKGLGSGFWWSAVTMTTVGYGDKTPRTAAGRAVAVLWMFVAVITISGFTASIASSLTAKRLAEVSGPADLMRVRVGTVASSSSEEHLRSERIAFQVFNSLPEALQQLAEGDVDAVVYDIPLLAYQLERHPEWSHISVLPGGLTIQQYAFGLPTNSELREPLNRVIPAYMATLTWRAKVEGY